MEDTNTQFDPGDYARCYDAVSTGIVVYDAKGLIAYANRAALDILELTLDELLGQPSFDPRHQAVREDGTRSPHEEHAAAAAARDGIPVSEGVLGLTSALTSQRRWVLSNCEPVFGPDGVTVARVVCTLTDITDQKDLQFELETSLARHRALWDLSKMTEATEKELYDFVLSASVELTGSHYGFIGFIDEDRNTLTLASWDAQVHRDCRIPGRHHELPLGALPRLGKAAIEKTPVIVNDFGGQELTLPDGHVQIERLLAVPVLRSNKTEVLIGVANKPSPFNKHDADQLALLGHGAMTIIDRQQLEERYRLVADFTHDWEYWMGNDGGFVYMSPSCERVTGYHRQAFIDDPDLLMRIVHPADQERLRKETMQTKQTEAPMFTDFRIVRADGQARWIARRCQTVYGRDGAPMGRRASNRDITERIEAQQRQLETERQAEEQKRRFYKETIQSVTNGKLAMCTSKEVEPYVLGSDVEIEVHNAAEDTRGRTVIRKFCERNGLRGEPLAWFMMAVGEATGNAIKHGKKGKVCLGASEQSVWVCISDKGQGISSLTLPQAVLLRGFSTKPSLGLGYSIMLDAADQILLQTGDKGTTVVLVKNIAAPTPIVSVESLPDTWDSIPS